MKWAPHLHSGLLEDGLRRLFCDPSVRKRQERTVASNSRDDVGSLGASDQPEPDGSDRTSHDPVNIAAQNLAFQAHQVGCIPSRFPALASRPRLHNSTFGRITVRSASYGRGLPSIEELAAAVSHGPALTREHGEVGQRCPYCDDAGGQVVPGRI